MRRTVKVCPYCGSSDLSYEAGMMTGQKYRCKGCKYVGPLVLEMDADEYERNLEKASVLAEDVDDDGRA